MGGTEEGPGGTGNGTEGTEPAVRSSWGRFFTSFLDLMLPPLCHCCRTAVAGGEAVHICPVCRSGLTPIASPLCSVCGRPFAGAGPDNHPCGACMTFPPPFAAARAAFLYRATVRELVHHFKYGGKVQLRRPLGLLTARELAPFASFFAPQLLLPVPLHVRRLRQRGFNQAVLLGEVLARQWGVPLDRYQLLRTRWTEPQVNLSAAERVANVRGAFAVAAKHGLAGKRVLLVDDVYTTGSTVRECARLLAQAGAAAVGVVTVARAEE